METNKPVKSNSRKAFKYRQTECLNCGQSLDLSDRYCSYCSQLNTSKQLSVRDFISEFVGSILVYDSRLRYTVKDLLFKPGTITFNYVGGKRLKYANPFRFFLSVSIIYFLLQGLITTFSSGKSPFLNLNNNGNPVSLDSLQNKNLTFPNGNGSLDTLVISGNTFKINSDTIAETPKKTEKVFEYISETDLDTLDWSNRLVERFSMYRDFYKLHDIKNADVALDSLKHRNTSFNRWVYNKNSAFDRIADDPFGFLNYMMGKTPFFLFFFAPFFAFFFWLIYSKSKYTYMEHMIFIFHIFSFLFLAFLICLIPDTFLNDGVFSGIVFALIGPFYFYKALRNFYKQNRLITIIKFVFLNIVFWISSTFAALVFFAISAAAY
ncbi:uncharacterized protein DUF3667 [Ulvibacter sp. MAR_2010_11]|uniref:DUF3667 domain-containing protein n=1 Tax=Ulvibacter sp. MAR_2010_11 TaxID=1250229 RepID=UPI000C2C5E72|nr:DUF3667 domain-containing protein [Ulvibacter sp. MAR_2010_11]PKA82312.1 uncharacterized protein DUF3667 [Ulvibacter sp. MAR_2010_11]